MIRKKRLRQKKCPGITPEGEPCPHPAQAKHHYYRRWTRNGNPGLKKFKEPTCFLCHSYAHTHGIRDGETIKEFFARHGAPSLAWGNNKTVKLIVEGKGLRKITADMYQVFLEEQLETLFLPMDLAETLCERGLTFV